MLDVDDLLAGFYLRQFGFHPLVSYDSGQVCCGFSLLHLLYFGYLVRSFAGDSSYILTMRAFLDFYLLSFLRGRWALVIPEPARASGSELAQPSAVVPATSSVQGAAGAMAPSTRPVGSFEGVFNMASQVPVARPS